MRVRAEHVGRQLPFERERRLVLRRLPVGAVVTRAVLTLTPVSTDPGGQFLETISFADGQGDWGATKVTTGASVEVALHARRKLASLVGSGLGNVPLLADIGGGFMAVNSAGGLGDGAPLLLTNSTPLPGLTVTGIRATPGTSPDVSTLRVSSPPSNVTVAVEGGPVFCTHLGDLMGPVTTPDFADLLQGLLPRLDVENGCHVVPFVLHSDTIARLDLGLEVEYTLAVPAAPPGVRTVQAQYAYDGAPVAGQGRLAITVPPGMVAVEGGTVGRAQGAFAETRVVFGPVTGQVPPELVVITAGQSLAQPFVLPGTQVATSVDVLLTAVTAEVALAVDVVNDLDGKPGRTSLLGRPADVRLTRDTAGSPTWVSVPLPGEVEVLAGVPRWLVVQARTGSAAWSAGADDGSGGAAVAAGAPAGVPSGPGLQQTRDGGLSWRAVDGTTAPAPLRAPLRLRHVTQGFQMPLELRVGAGGPEGATGEAAEVAVDLQRFAASGTVDFDLGFPEVAQAMNQALAAAPGRAVDGGGERVANGDFVDWYRVGNALGGFWAIDLPDPKQTFGTLAFGPDSRVVHTVVSHGGDAVYVRMDVIARRVEEEQVIGAGVPVALAVDATGRTGLVALDDGEGAGFAANHGDPGRLLLLDLATGRRVGAEVAAEEPVLGLAASADGLGVYVVGMRFVAGGLRTTVRHVPWSDLHAAAAGTPVAWSSLPFAEVDGQPRDVATGPDGRVVVLTESFNAAGSSTGTDVVTYAGRAAVAADDAVTVEGPPGARQVAVAGDEVLVLAADVVRYARADDLTTLTDLPYQGPGAQGWAFAVAPAGDVAVVVRQERLNALDVPNRRWLPEGRFGIQFQVTSEGSRVVINPAGTHAVSGPVGRELAELVTIGTALPAEWELTAGVVAPYSLESTGEVFALLGSARQARGDDREGVVGPSAISQVVPAVGGAPYRFTFDGLSTVEGAVAQVRWNGDRCSPERTDRVPVTVFDRSAHGSLDRVPHHEALLVAPAGATQAEIRFWLPEEAMIVDKVSLLGSADVVSGTWTPAAPTTTVLPSDAGLTISNGGAAPTSVTQLVSARPGDVFELEVTASVSGEPGAAVELAFQDDTAAPVGELVRVPLDALDFDVRSAAGVVPAGAVEAELRVVLPPGAVVELVGMRLTLRAATDVGLYFASEAPGDLSLSDVGVTFEAADPRPVPVPPGGLCPPTQPGEGPDGEACHCQGCGTRGPVKQAQPALSPAGRPVVVTPCPTCGAQRLRLGGRPMLRARQVALPRFRVEDRGVAARATGVSVRSATGVSVRSAASGRPAIVARLRVAEPLEAIDGIAASRAARLVAAGIRDVVALSRADVQHVATLPGVSEAIAADLIAQARRLVREKGERVVFE